MEFLKAFEEFAIGIIYIGGTVPTLALRGG
jgi:hypothetical protein